MITKRGRGNAAPFLCLVATLLPVPATADDIVVTARRADPESVRTEAQAFARTVEAAPVDGQVARWNEPVCPSVSGVDKPVAAIVAAEIRAVAARSGAKVGGDTCRANVIVSFTLDARALVAAMTKRRSQLLLAASPPERAFIRDSDAPVRWWYVTDTEGADGTQMTQESAALLGQDANVPTTGTQRFANTYSSSLVRSPFRASLKGVVVIVDAERATGTPLSDVAAYVAFVALARIKALAPVPSTPSILGLFAGGSTGLSKWDAAYLKALYAAPVDRTAATQRSRMTVAMVKALSAR